MRDTRKTMVRPGRTIVWTAAFILLSVPSFLPAGPVPLEIRRAAGGRPGEQLSVDFRYAPPRWDTAICFPDDWLKTLVSEDGSLQYDFPGKFNRFQTRITVSLAGSAEPARVEQRLQSPRIPVVITEKDYPGCRIRERAFARPLEPGAAGAAEEKAALEVECLPPCDGNANWAQPSVPCDQGFTSIAVGWNRPVEYRFRADAAARFQIAFGICEGWHGEPGRRILDLDIEGRIVRTVDMVKEKGKNAPAVFIFPARDEDGDGWVSLASRAHPGSPDTNPILNVLWVFPAGMTLDPEDVLGGQANAKALARVDCGAEGVPEGDLRSDIVQVTLEGTDKPPTSTISTYALEVTVKSTHPIDLRGNGNVVIGGRTYLAVTPAPAESTRTPEGVTLVLPPADIKPGSTSLATVSVARGRGARFMPCPPDEAVQAWKDATGFWQRADLPWDRIRVPDPGVQAIIDSAIRNIYQAREIKKGLPAFQVGPTCYRGLWVVDGSFLLEAITFLGRIDEARAGVRYLLGFQQDDGSFMLIRGHWKETGIALWAISRHARLTNDRDWLEGVWHRVRGGVAFIRSMRDMASKDPKAPEYRLVPRGFSDGGLGGEYPEYTNIYWTLVGLRAAVGMAEWLEKAEDARAWRAEYDDFFSTFKRACERDARTDAHGNRHVPIRMVDDQNVAPQKGQWAFLHAVFPGKIFEVDDPLMLGTLGMLDAAGREGLVFGTGWMSDGIWNYFGSFYGHAHLWLGHGRRAAEILYAFINHASPLLAWREEQHPKGAGEGIVGDMPHNWASAECLRLVRHMIALERGAELHLLAGVPREWTLGGQIRLKEIFTDFGPLSLELTFDPEKRSARLRGTIPARTPPERVVLHVGEWAGEKSRLLLDGKPADPERLTVAPGEPFVLEVQGIPRGSGRR